MDGVDVPMVLVQSTTTVIWPKACLTSCRRGSKSRIAFLNSCQTSTQRHGLVMGLTDTSLSSHASNTLIITMDAPSRVMIFPAAANAAPAVITAARVNPTRTEPMWRRPDRIICNWSSLSRLVCNKSCQPIVNHRGQLALPFLQLIISAHLFRIQRCVQPSVECLRGRNIVLL